MPLYVVVRNGRAVIAFPTYAAARAWVGTRSDAVLYFIDRISLSK